MSGDDEKERPKEEERALAFISMQAKKGLEEADNMTNVAIVELNEFKLMLEPDTDANVGLQFVTFTVT